MKNPRTGKNPTGQSFSRCWMPTALIRTPGHTVSVRLHFLSLQLQQGCVWKVGCMYKTILSFCSSIGWLSHTLLNTVNPTSHHPLMKNPEVFQSAKKQVTQRKGTSFSGFISHISSHCTFFNSVKGPDFKGKISHYLIPAWEREENKAEVSWRDALSSLSSTVLYYFVSHPPNPLPADTPVLAE